MASLRDDISQLNESLHTTQVEMEGERKKKEGLAKKAAGRFESKETQICCRLFILCDVSL